MKAIIPACGFGTRVNMTPNQSKELLPGPNGEPLIQYHLDRCHWAKIKPCVLVRPEKTDLIRYLAEQEVEVVIMEPGKEWAETIYKSQDHWANLNVLILPDTRYEPASALSEIKKSLEFGCEIVFAVHKVNNISKWGYVNSFQFCEKPSVNDPGYAWGLIGFTKEAGERLFYYMQNKDLFINHTDSTNFIFLEKFEDLTRVKT